MHFVPHQQTNPHNFRFIVLVRGVGGGGGRSLFRADITSFFTLFNPSRKTKQPVCYLANIIINELMFRNLRNEINILFLNVFEGSGVRNV